MSSIHPTALVDGKAQLGEDADIGGYAVIGPDVVIGDGTRIMSHVVLDGRTTIGARCTVFPFASIGTRTQDLKYDGGETFVEIGDGTTIREYVTVNSGTADGEVTRVGDNCLIMAYCHVAHKCEVGNSVIMSNNAQLSGHVIIEDNAIIGGMTGVHQFVRVGTMSFVGGLSRITKDVPPYFLVEGSPAVAHGINAVGLKRHEVKPDVRTSLKEAYRMLYREGLSTSQALEKIAGIEQTCPELENLVSFVQGSERGIVK